MNETLEYFDDYTSHAIMLVGIGVVDNITQDQEENNTKPVLFRSQIINVLGLELFQKQIINDETASFYSVKSDYGNETINPTIYPTINPTIYPTVNPTNNPTNNPTTNPTRNPTNTPSTNPTKNPTNNNTAAPGLSLTKKKKKDYKIELS